MPLNVAIKSSQVGDAGRSLSVIAQHLGDAYGGLVGLVTDLTQKADSVAHGLSDAVFYLGWARLQFEMTLIYYRELLNAASGDEATSSRESLANSGQNLKRLRMAFERTAQTTTSTLRNVDQMLRKLNAGAGDLAKTMLQLQVSHVAGLVEVSRLQESTEFAAIFDDIRSHISRTQQAINGFASIIDKLRHLASRTPAVTAAITTAQFHMQSGENRLGGSQGSSIADTNATVAAPPVDHANPVTVAEPTLSGVA